MIHHSPGIQKILTFSFPFQDSFVDFGRSCGGSQKLVQQGKWLKALPGGKTTAKKEVTFYFGVLGFETPKNPKERWRSMKMAAFSIEHWDW